MAALRQKCLLLKKLIVSPSSLKHNASVIFLHGLGDEGPGVKAWVDDVLGEEFKFPHIKLIYPTAHPRPFTMSGGMLSTVWYDREDFHPDSRESPQEIIKESAAAITRIIEDEVKSGIPEDRIIVGGFSQGGAMAFYMGYIYRKTLAGIFGLSSYINRKSVLYDSLKENTERTPPLFQAHGQRDDLVLYEWGKETSNRLKEFGVDGEFHTFPELGHEPGKEELLLLKEWILKLLPPQTSSL